MTLEEKRSLLMRACHCTSVLAMNIAEIYASTLLIASGVNEVMVDAMLSGTYDDMQTLGDLLNGSDAVTPEDAERFEGVFAAMNAWKSP